MALRKTKKRLRPMQDSNVMKPENRSLVDLNVFFDALEEYKSCAAAKFDESVDVSFKLGIDPKKSDQMINGVFQMPHGNGKPIKILAFTDDHELAVKAGADIAGGLNIVEALHSGSIVPGKDFHVAIASPNLMPSLVKVAKLLGVRGMMPSLKSGTVTSDITKLIGEIKAGRTQFKNNSAAFIKMSIGRVSFTKEHITQNLLALYNAIKIAKTSAVKDNYFSSLSICTTMMGMAFSIKISSLSNA